MMESPRSDWRALDVVSANLIYKDHMENYTDIKVGNKAPTSQSMKLADSTLRESLAAFWPRSSILIRAPTLPVRRRLICMAANRTPTNLRSHVSAPIGAS